MAFGLWLRAAEGVRLRAALGADGPFIYVLDGCHGDDAAMLKASDLRPVLNYPAQIQAWRAAGGGTCGLQIDTGMNRLGIRPEDAPEAFDGLALVLTHLACADEPANPMNRRQRDAFTAAAALAWLVFDAHTLGLVLLGLAGVLACLALAGPSWQQGEAQNFRRNDPLVVVLALTPVAREAFHQRVHKGCHVPGCFPHRARQDYRRVQPDHIRA